LNNYSLNHKPIYYQKAVFASKWINNSIDLNSFFEIRTVKDYSAFNNPEILFEIGLFDIWVENDDRKPSNQNLLLVNHLNKFDIYPIDHAFIFSSLDYLNLDPSNFIGSTNDNIFESSLARSLINFKKKSRHKIKFDEQKFYQNIQNCKDNYVNIVKNIPESWGFTKSHSEKLHHFLFNEDRNKKVFEEYKYKFK
jgi:hypothetical protein